jgi:hypothetical protein
MQIYPDIENKTQHFPLYFQPFPERNMNGTVKRPNHFLSDAQRNLEGSSELK